VTVDARPSRPIDAAAAPPPGQAALLGAGLALGMLLLAVQLWLLTIALELYLGGHAHNVWLLALISGVIFLGGLAMLWVLRRRPRVLHGAAPPSSAAQVTGRAAELHDT
jgi:hypothetical protein